VITGRARRRSCSGDRARIRGADRRPRLGSGDRSAREPAPSHRSHLQVRTCAAFAIARSRQVEHVHDHGARQFDPCGIEWPRRIAARRPLARAVWPRRAAVSSRRLVRSVQEPHGLGSRLGKSRPCSPRGKKSCLDRLPEVLEVLACRHAKHMLGFDLAQTMINALNSLLDLLAHAGDLTLERCLCGWKRRWRWAT
jgi:hypothetical protein